MQDNAKLCKLRKNAYFFAFEMNCFLGVIDRTY